MSNFYFASAKLGDGSKLVAYYASSHESPSDCVWIVPGTYQD